MSLSEATVDRALEKLELARRPEPTLKGLSTVYSAWCRHVPFDNVRKLIHVRRADPGVLPGDDAGDFFDHWLRFGAGGTCWAGNGALCELLGSLGFSAARAVGAMLVAPNLPPNHGSAMVLFDGRRYLVDASILHEEPLLLEAPLRLEASLRLAAPASLDERAPAAAAAPAWSAAGSFRDGHWYIRWRPVHKLQGIDCRIDHFDADVATFRRQHEQTRGWSPFNYGLHARMIRGTSVIGTAFGQRVEFNALGEVAERPLPASDRVRFLVEEMGIHEELAVMVPEELPIPLPT